MFSGLTQRLLTVRTIAQLAAMSALSLVWACNTCSRDRADIPREKTAALPETRSVRELDTATSSELVTGRANSPLPAPVAYFGEPAGLERIDDSIKIQTSERGHILLVVIDTLNAKHLGVYGYERATSPNIDALARDGLTFTNYVSNCSWTRPSMATILTGLSKNRHQVELKCADTAGEITTLAQYLAEAGYRTGAFIGNPLVSAKCGFDRGFETFVEATSLQDYGFVDDGEITEHALKWLSDRGQRPFFALVVFTAPHHPYAPPQGFDRFSRGLHEGQVMKTPLREYPGGMDPADRERTVAAYDGEVLYADAQVGALLAYLRKEKLFDSTTVIVTADHGEAFGEHNCFQHTYHQWEPVLRVPFVISSPALPAGGLYDDRPYTHLDIAPTLLDLAGIDRAIPEFEGESIVDALTDPHRGRERKLFAQYNAHGIRRQTIRKGRFKLIHHHAVDRSATSGLMMFSTSRDEPPSPEDLPTIAWNAERFELYDLDVDPGELVDLFERRKTAPQTAELVSYVVDYLAEDQDVSVEIDDDLRRALEAVGYIAPSAEPPIP